MSVRYYGAVWVDYLHYAHDGKLTINLVETDEKGRPLRHAAREHVDGPTAPTEQEIVDRLLPGAVFAPTSGNTEE